MTPAVFKTVEVEDLGLGGSIPLRLRQLIRRDGMLGAWTPRWIAAA